MGSGGDWADGFGGSPAVLELAAVVAFNLVPLVGVILWNWSLAAILMLYWFENLVVGVLNVPKTVLSAGESSEVDRPGPKEALLGVASYGVAVYYAGSFVLRYGVLWAFQGVLVLALFLDGVDHLATIPPAILVGVLGLTANRCLEFYRDFWREREYLARSPSDQMSQPYPRLAVLYLTILLAVVLSGPFGTPVGMLVLLVVLKTVYDVAALVIDLYEDESGRDVGWSLP